MEAIGERSEHPEQTVTLMEIIPRDNTRNLLSLTDCEKSVLEDQLDRIHIVDNALQISIDSLLMEDLDSISDLVADTPSHQARATYWLPSVANSDVPVQTGETPPQKA